MTSPMIKIDLGEIPVESKEKSSITPEDLVSALVGISVGGRVDSDLGSIVRVGPSEFKVELNKSHYYNAIKGLVGG